VHWQRVLDRPRPRLQMLHRPLQFRHSRKYCPLEHHIVITDLFNGANAGADITELGNPGHQVFLFAMRLSSSSFLLNNGEYFKASFPSLSFSGIPTRDTSVLGISGIESQTPISEPPTAVLLLLPLLGMRVCKRFVFAG
jgi:hypothetical protein